jgi:hypothetical protein
MVACYEQSGLTQSAFCTEHSLSLHVFTYWLRRYRSDHRSVSAVVGAGFKEILAASPDLDMAHSFVRIRDNRGIELEFGAGVSAAFLRSLLSW